MRKLPAAIVLLFVMAALTCPQSQAADFVLPTITETETVSPGAIIKQKNYFFDNGDYFWSRKYIPDGDGGVHYTSVNIQGDSGRVRYYDEESSLWRIIPLEGVMPCANLHIDTDKEYMILSPTYVYKPADNDCIEEQPSQRYDITVEKKDGYFTIAFRFPVKKGLVGYVWALQSKQEPVPWSRGATANMWASYNSQNQRWSYDGYFDRSPSTYSPYSENMFWRSPGAHLLHSFTRTGQSRASDDLSYVMLDTLSALQNDDGYWPSAPSSDWLEADFGIGAGFYDTRFNCDMVQTFFRGYEKWRDPRFLEAAEAGAAWYMEYAGRHHFTFTTTDGGEGWLVRDYSRPGHAYKDTHASLNHHLAGIQLLLTGYNTTQNEDYLALAEKLLYGIKLTRDYWLREDGSLHYAILPDGSYGMQDYAYLTYDDLVKVQRMRGAMGYPDDPDLQYLIDAKRAQMDRDGVTGYIK